MIFAAVATQVLARTTRLLNGRKSVHMTGQKYMRAVVPIGVVYSGSLVCSNLPYLYLSVPFIQMLKVRQRSYSRFPHPMMLTNAVNIVGRPRHSPPDILALGRRQAHTHRCPEDPHHSPRRYDRLGWRDPDQLARRLVPDRWAILRGDAARHDTGAALGRRREDGPASQSILLRPHMRRHEYSDGVHDGVGYFPDGRLCEGRAFHTATKRHGSLWLECCQRILGG